MDAPPESDLLSALSDVAAPRRRRGRQYAWPVLLTLLAAALACGERRVRAIGQWVAEHAEELGAALAPPRGRRPSTATLGRGLRAVEVTALEQRRAIFAAGLPTPPTGGPATGPWSGQAMDGTARDSPRIRRCV